MTYLANPEKNSDTISSKSEQWTNIYSAQFLFKLKIE